MTYPNGLTPHVKRIWALAMQWPIPKGTKIDGLRTMEDSTAHGCPMMSNGKPRVLYLHLEIVEHLLELDKQFSFGPTSKAAHVEPSAPWPRK